MTAKPKETTFNRPDLNLSHHSLAVKVENKAGVLARVADLFARRGYNIVSLAVAPIGDEAFSRLTIVVDVESAPLEQIVKQLFKLVNVVEIIELPTEQSVERELLVATVDTSGGKRSELLELVDIFKGKILAVAPEAMTVSLDGDPQKVSDFHSLLRDYGVIDLQRTGRIAVPRIGHSPNRVTAEEQ